jgi:hypothetical protein
MKALAAGIAGLMVAVGVAGGVYVATQEGGEAEVVQDLPTVSGKTTPSQTAAPSASVPGSATPTPITIPTNWATYTDPALGFSLRYPRDLLFKEEGDPAPTDGTTERTLQFRSAEDRRRSVTIAIWSKPKGMSLEEWVRGATQCIPETIVKGTIAGTTAYLCSDAPAKQVITSAIFEDNGIILYVTSVMPVYGFESDFDSVIASIEL